MGAETGIEWCDHAFIPWYGCTKVSAGCANCYAETAADKRFHLVEWGPGKPRRSSTPAKWREPLKWDRIAAETGTRPRVFCSSWSDVFDPEVDKRWLNALCHLIDRCQNLVFLLLTKRPHLIRELLGRASECDDGLRGWWLSDSTFPPNVWIGTSVEDQAAADERIPHLLAIPAAKRFLSCEPLLGPVRLDAIHYRTSGPEGSPNRWALYLDALTGFRATSMQGGTDGPGIDWVIAGGESGPKARPCHPDWARSLRDQCQAAGVPFLFKQWGEWADATSDESGSSMHRGSREDLIFTAAGETLGAGYRDRNGGAGLVDPDWRERGAAWMCKVGKKRAGRLLDGVLHDEVPTA